MENKKIIAIVIGVLFGICLILGIIGLLENKKVPKIEPTKNYQVTYKYYVNDTEVSQMPINPKQIIDNGSSIASSNEINVEQLYAFNTATCTNNVTYTWDADNWKFTPSNTADSTCSLYFVTTYNNVKIEASNAKISDSNEMKIKRGEDAVIKLTPTEGYEFEKVECSNNSSAEWDKDAKELIVRSVTTDTSCKISFVMSKFNVEIQVNFGNGTTKVEYEYGKQVEIKNITPAEEYGNPDIVCTNGQTPVWKDNVLTIEKLTNSTKCTVTFKKLQSKTEYVVTLDVGTNGTIISGPNPTKVLVGGSVSWNVRVNEGYIIADEPTCNNGHAVVAAHENDYTVTLKDVTQDAQCSIIYRQGE